jgi:hypothetical protein
MNSDIFPGSSESDCRIEGADSPDHESETNKKPVQKKLTSDKPRYNGRPHRMRYIKIQGPKSNRSSAR